MNRLSVLLALVLVVGLITFGCSGDGSGLLNVVIGPGPGPMAVIMPEPPAGGVDTVAARMAPLATAPDPDAVQVGLLDLLDGLAANPPTDGAAMRNLLSELTLLVANERNDPASQFTLAIAVVLAGMYNAAIDMGVPPAEVFALLPDLLGMFSAQDKAVDIGYQEIMLQPVQLMTSLYMLGPAMQQGSGGGKAIIPGLEDWGISTESVQIAIRNYLLPALYSGIERAEAVVNNANPPTDPLLVDLSGGEGWAIYPADVEMVLAFFHALRSLLHELVAYQLNWGDYDWSMDIVTRDADGDGILTPAEYAPADPFLWLHPAPNMQAAGDALKAAIDAMVWAIRNRGDDSLVAAFVDSQPQTPAEMVTWLNDLRTLLTSRVDVQVDYDTVYVAEIAPAATTTVPLNLGVCYYSPIGDIKDLLPRLHVVCDLDECWPELAGPGDFPDLTFNGMFPNPAALGAIVASEPNQVTITYNSIEIPLLDPEGFGLPIL